MKTQLIILPVLFFVFSSAMAQDCQTYFPFTKGARLEYTDYDGKDKESGTHTMIVQEISNTAGYTDAKVAFTSKDDKMKEAAKSEYLMRCKGNEFFFDMKSFTASAMEGFKDMQIEAQASYLTYPANMTVGTALPDGEMVMTISQNGTVFSTMTSKVLNRKVAATETITTPAGTFECLKITFDVEMVAKTMGLPSTTQTSGIEWIAKGIGTVKSETYMKNGKKAGYSLLTKKS
ncbi:MAG: hypothetical protein V2A54_07540 [Bacteroidota bacterium]